MICRVLDVVGTVSFILGQGNNACVQREVSRKEQMHTFTVHMAFTLILEAVIEFLCQGPLNSQIASYESGTLASSHVICIKRATAATGLADCT